MRPTAVQRTTLAIAAICLATSLAHADDEIVRGAVVKVEAAEIYVNLGKDRAVDDGAALRLKRTIRLQHPVTRAMFEDWVPIGSAVVTQAGSKLSRAVLGPLVDEVRVGDVAEVLIDRQDAAPANAVPVVAQPSGPPGDPATAEVLASFTTQAGQSLDARIAVWERYLSTHPRSPYAEAIRRDVDTLNGLREQMRPTMPAGVSESGVSLAHTGPTSAAHDAAIPLVFVLDQPEHVASAYLHYRLESDRTYRRLLLVREHEIYLRGVIPAGTAKPPGVDYFVEVSTPNGGGGVALGSPARPLHIAVSEPPLADRFGPTPGRSSVRITGEALDFATFDTRAGNRRDRVVNATVDFTYRIDRIVQSVGVGYGVFAGQGGFADRVYGLEEPLPRSAFQYGYADLELAVPKSRVPVSFGGKLIAGVGKEGFGIGAEGRMRLGNRDAANLMLVASTIDQVGFLADIKFGARPTSDLGFAVSVGATDQPNRGDVGVKLGSELEYFASPHFSMLLRASWQGRTTEHGGIGGGAGVGFTW
jgi:hypothetical protein